MLAEGMPTAVVLVNGGQVALGRVGERADAILEAFFPGVHGARAIAATLWGERNPGGKLPVTVYPADFAAQTDFGHVDDGGRGRGYRYYEGTPHLFFWLRPLYTTFELGWAAAAPPVATFAASAVPVRRSRWSCAIAAAWRETNACSRTSSRRRRR